MGIQINHPILLALVLPFIGLYAYWMWRYTLRLSGSKKTIVVSIRVLILLLLLFAITGVSWFEKIERQAIVFVVDQSDSMADSSDLLRWMQEATNTKKELDLSGVVSVGAEGVVEKYVDERNLQAFRFNARTNRQFTNLTSGLRLAESLLPREASPRIMLASDGKENIGDILRQGKLLQNRGIPVDVLILPSKTTKDASIEEVKLPERLYQGEQFTLETVLSSTEATKGLLRIYEDSNEIASQQVELEKGENRFVLQGLASEPGHHRYRVELYVEGDEQSTNNAGYAFSRVSGPPKVLVVEGQFGRSLNVPRMLDAGLIPYDRIIPEQLSIELADYTSYDSILLDNVPATRLSERQMELLERAVRDYGVGLMMVGGEDSFGLGGYFDTPVESALPVYMDLRGKRQIPSLGLILVIDKSGSMLGEKMELAKEAAARSIQLLREQDTIGVLAFDSSPWWVVGPQKLIDRKKVNDDVFSIVADGGTEIYTAVQEAYDQLLKVDAQRKHIILLTDGQSSSQQGYHTLAANMVNNNITMSTVAIGQDSDQALLSRIAELAKGRYYYTDDQSTVPAIFSRETVMMSRTYIVDSPFTPIEGQGSDWLRSMPEGLPPIQGYIATTPKETAEVVLLSPELDPLLARWQYGAGRTVAWTSDLSGKWSADWVAWDRLPYIFSEWVKWTYPQFDAAPIHLSTHWSGREITLTARSQIDDFQGELLAVITDDALNDSEIRFTPTAPGEYTAKLAMDRPGAYLARVDVLASAHESVGNGRESMLLGSITEGFVVPYSPEYRLSLGDQANKLIELANLTGGRVLAMDRPQELYQGEVSHVKIVHELTSLLLKLSLILWLLDIAARRLSVSWTSWRIPYLQRPFNNAKNVTQHKWISPSRERLMNLPKHSNAAAESLREDHTSGVSEPAQNHTTSTNEPAANANDTLNRLLSAKNRGNKR